MSLQNSKNKPILLKPKPVSAYAQSKSKINQPAQLLNLPPSQFELPLQSAMSARSTGTGGTTNSSSTSTKQIRFKIDEPCDNNNNNNNNKVQDDNDGNEDDDVDDDLGDSGKSDTDDDNNDKQTAHKKKKNKQYNNEIDKNNNNNNKEDDDMIEKTEIPEVYKTQGSDGSYASICPGYAESTCLCSFEDAASNSNSNLPGAKRLSYLDRRNWITTDRLYELRKQATEATKNHKTFTIRGCFYSIRKGLIQRGWVEKLDIHRRAPITGLCHMILEDFTQNLPMRRPGESRRQHLTKCERNIMSRFLEHIPIDFLWSARKEKTDWIDMARNPTMTINKFHKSPFTTKEGLCTVLKDFHWYFEEGKSELYNPRSYNVWMTDDLNEFVENFRMTACISTLRYFVETMQMKNKLLLEQAAALAAAALISSELDDSIDDGGGIINNKLSTNNSPILLPLLSSSQQSSSSSCRVPVTCITFAINQCKSFIRSCLHYDIDEEQERVWDHDWDVFLMHHQMLTQDNAEFNDTTGSIKALAQMAEKVLEEISHHWSQFNLDGVYNIWIVKPSNRCRGRGIQLMNDLKKILNFVNPPVVNKGHYVVQKYIERPLIIHNCKFDIRQWFLVTSVQPLVIWMYKESYLRFSSQEFDLVNFHESVHLTNHAIQKRYKNGRRDERLPKENMWDCHTFQAYLRQIGMADMWSERIYPGMQKALIGTMLASQDTMDRRINTFELFGADFMVSEDCQPWLIEINSSPDLGASTSVTARLCPQCLEDVVKVVIDYRNDPKASTGEFELIYKQVIPPAPAYLGLNLFLKGTQLLPSKNGGQSLKKDTKTTMNKLKNQSRDSHLNGGTINASRPFLMDIFDNMGNGVGVGDKTIIDKSQKKPSTATTRAKSFMVAKKPTNLDLSSVGETKLSKSSKLSPHSNGGGGSNNKINNMSTTTATTGTSTSATPPPPPSTALPPSTSAQQATKLFYENIQKRAKLINESARRHASCGPRMMTVQTVNGNNTTCNETLTTEEIILHEIETTNVKKDFQCIGSKCCVENLPPIISDGGTENIGSKYSLENGSTRKEKHKLRSKSSILNSNKNNGGGGGVGGVGSSGNKQSQKYLSVNNKDYQKYVNRNFNLNKLQKTTNINGNNKLVSGGIAGGSGVGGTSTILTGDDNQENYCSHFFAVGLSLRAWRSKYNKILKTQKDMAHIPISHSFGTYIVRKGKKPLVKIRKQAAAASEAVTTT